MALTGRTESVRLAALAALAAALLLGTAGCSATGAGASVVGSTGPAASGAPVTSDAPTSAADRGALEQYQDPDLGGAESEREATGVVPERVTIGGIGVDSGLESLSRDADGALLPPTDFGSAGWYAQGVVPGDIGPAVIAGHIDSAVGPAVFYQLSSLKAGDPVEVTMSDGSVLTFTVDRSIQVAKADFPTEEVYGPTPTAQLRLITCGGVFDDDWGHYLDNVVVFASETG